MERAARHMMDVVLSKAWGTWVDFVMDCRRMHGLVARAVLCWEDRLSALAIRGWKEVRGIIISGHRCFHAACLNPESLQESAGLPRPALHQYS